MSEIHAKISAIDNYKSNLKSTYDGIKNLAATQKEEIHRWREKVVGYCNFLDTKISQILSLEGRISSLISLFQTKIIEWGDEAQRIYNSGHWIETSDDEGHVTSRTYVYDVVAYNAAKAKQAEYEMKLNEAQKLFASTQKTRVYLVNVKKNLDTNLSQLSSNLNKYNQGISAVSAKSSQNIEKINSIIGSLRNYAGSKSFADPSTVSAPSISYVSSYSESSGGSSINLGKIIEPAPNSLGGIFTKHRNPANSSGNMTAQTSGSSGSLSSESMSSDMNHKTQNNRFEHFADDAYINPEKTSKSLKQYEKRSNIDKEILKSHDCNEHSIKEYCENDVPDINRVLSSEEKREYSVSERMDREKYLEKAMHLSEAISYCSLSSSMSLYRGQGIKSIANALNCDFDNMSGDELKKLIGSEFQINCFTSTSCDKSVAERYANKRNSVILDIEAPVGTQAIHVGKFSSWGSSVSKEIRESEIIIQQGSKYLIQDVGYTGPSHERQYYMKVKLVAQQKHPSQETK